MNQTQRRNHYLSKAQQHRKAGEMQWAKLYAKLAIRVMESR